jgi:hypothetical protein
VKSAPVFRSALSDAASGWVGMQQQRGISSANKFFFFPLNRDKTRKRVNKELNKYISEKERSHKYKFLLEEVWM